MSQLPTKLAAWGEQLAGMQPFVAKALADLAGRLTAGIGPLKARQAQGAQDPDGFDGLVRRGPYERLLTTEWLLAQEAPLEFLRRATMGEHAFMALARREPRRVETCAVLLDGGPDQLGAPRIAQLAVLMCLARRAEEVGAEFRWGLLQDPKTQIFGSIHRASVSAFLNARTSRDPTEDDVRRWEWLLGHEQPDNVWWIGGPALVALHAANRQRPAPDHQVVIEEPSFTEFAALEPVAGATGDAENPLLVVTITQGGRVQPRLELRRPSNDVEVMLLNEPFGADSDDSGVASQRPSTKRWLPHLEVLPNRRMFFSPAGRRLFVATRSPRSQAPVWVAASVPSASARRASHDRTVEPLAGQQLVGLGWSRKSLLRLDLDATLANEGKGRLTLQAEFGRDPVAKEPLQVAIEMSDYAKLRAQGPGLLVRGWGRNPHALRLVGPRSARWPAEARTLFGWDDDLSTVPWATVGDCLARPMGLVWTAAQHAQTPRVEMPALGSFLEHAHLAMSSLPPIDRPPVPLRLDRPPDHESQSATLFQLSWVDGQSRTPTAYVVFRHQLRSFPIGGVTDHVGAFSIDHRHWKPAVIVIDHVRRLRIYDAAGGNQVLPARGPVLQAVMSGQDPSVAWLTRAGQLAVYDLKRGTFVVNREVTIVEHDEESVAMGDQVGPS